MMKYKLGLLLALFTIGFPSATFAQETSGARDADQLRRELSQVLDRQAEIKIRLQELDYELKPENIERYFAGIGSTRPEQLREARRAKLQIEKSRLDAQMIELDQLRPRLEAQITTADAEAMQRSVMGATALTRKNSLDSVSTTMVLQIAAILFALLVLGFALVVRQKRSRRSKPVP